MGNMAKTTTIISNLEGRDRTATCLRRLTAGLQNFTSYSLSSYTAIRVLVFS
jgi:hypothetical protein